MKKWSLFLGSYAGIKVFVHWTFWIIVGWIFMMHFEMGHGWTEGIKGAFFIIVLFACVVLHEFGHALAAKKYNIPTRDITLYPIGGVASLNRMPDKPAQELVVALAGPVVNIVIAGILFVLLYVNDELLPISKIDHMSGEDFWFNIMAANVILAVFNLIPAFPMDGGRVLRALLAFRLDKLKATTIAARVGQFLAIIFVFLGFFSNFWLVFIGLFIYLGAGVEQMHESGKSALVGFTVKDVLIAQYTCLSPTETLGNLVQILQSTQEEVFLVTENNHVHGVLTRKDLIKGLSSYGNGSYVSDLMRKDFVTVDTNMPLQQVYEKLMSNNSQFATVLDDGQLKGIVTLKGINEMIMVTRERKK